jgi:hypothetical protein
VLSIKAASQPSAFFSNSIAETLHCWRPAKALDFLPEDPKHFRIEIFLCHEHE